MKNIYLVISLAGAMVLYNMAVPARAEPQGHTAIPGTTEFCAYAPSSLQAQNATQALVKFQSFSLQGGYVARGVGMRNRGFGHISVSGIPDGSTIYAAYLYWDILANTNNAIFSQGQINGQQVTGQLVATGGDPRWGNSANFAYRADVTSLVTGNGTYSLTNFASGTTDGSDPWTVGSSPPMMEGASLVIIYENSSCPPTTILIYEGATLTEGDLLEVTIDGFTAPSLTFNATTTFIGADGQAADKPGSTFNGNFLPTVGWDGSDPQDGPTFVYSNLWDTMSVDVTSLISPGDTNATATVQGGPDCLVWVAQVFSIGGDPLQIMPPTGFSACGPVGSPFTVTNETFSLTNIGTNSLNWSLANTASWLAAAPTGSTLSVGGTTNVNVWLNSNAYSLPLGVYTATLWFTNQSDNFGLSRQFTLTVTGPPIITCPSSNIIATATNLCGAVVNYAVTVSGGCPPITTNCEPPSGSLFPSGTNTVTCSAIDACGQSNSCSFRVTVLLPPSSPLTITCPGNITVPASNPGGAVVNYTVTVSGGYPPYTTNCVPPSGSLFPIGTTIVRCNPTDACGQSASCSFTVTVLRSGPLNPPFLFVDMDGAGGPTQSGFVSLPVPSEGASTFSMVLTSNYPPSQWAYSNQNTPTGAVTVVIVATNDEVNISTNVINPFPNWVSGVGNSPNGINRGTFTNGDPYSRLLQDFLCVSHDTMAGFGDDQVWVTVSNLAPGSNYEVTVWDFDQAVNDTSSGFYVAWSTNNPDPYGTNSYQPPYPGSPPNGGLCTAPRLARVMCAGPEPANEYAYSKSFVVASDANGSFTVYGWEDGDRLFGTLQWVPFNGFALGLATSPPPVPLTNLFTNIVINPPLTSNGPPTGWGYNAAGWNITSASYVNRTWGNPPSGVPMMGEMFVPSRDVVLRNFYIACQAATNTGLYTMALYDLGATNLTGASALIISNNPDTNNLLSYYNPYQPQQYWEFAPTNTSMAILKFRIPSLSYQVYLTNGHTYFFGLQYVPGSGSDNLVWEGTPTPNTYTDRAGFNYATLFRGNAYMTNMHGNLIMAIDQQNPNPVITVTNYALTNGTQIWPVLAGMGNSGKPVITTVVDQNDNSGGIHPGFLDFGNVSAGNGVAYEYVGREDGCPSMSFYNTNTFNLGAVAVVMSGDGSSNMLFTLNVYQMSNTFFTATDSVEHWPRNFQPSTDTKPLGLPVFSTNVDFYYPTNLSSGASTDQILVLTLPSQYQVTLAGMNGSNYVGYAVEFCGGDVGQNSSDVTVFMLERNNQDSLWQTSLFPDTGFGAGYRTNAASKGIGYEVTPETLRRAYPDPEQYAGGVIGAGQPRALVMALYAAVTNTLPTGITITSVTHNSNSTVLDWSATGGSGTYYFSVWRTNNLSTARSSWTEAASGLSAGTLTYTDTSATGTVNFYYIKATLSQ